MATQNPDCRQRILDEAEHLIHLQGFRATSLDEIAKRCKVTKANVLHHFGSKENLGLAVLDYKIECYRKCFLDRVFAPGGAPDAAVETLFREAATFHEGNGCRAGCFVGNIALEMSDVHPKFRERADGFFQDWTDRLAGLMTARGVGKAAARLKAQAVLSIYEGAIMLARARRDCNVFNEVRPAALALVADLRETAIPTRR